MTVCLIFASSYAFILIEMHFFQISSTWPYYSMKPRRSRFTNLVDQPLDIFPINQTVFV